MSEENVNDGAELSPPISDQNLSETEVETSQGQEQGENQGQVENPESAIIVSNPRGNSQPPEPPTKSDGKPYQFEMIYGDGRLRAYADTPTALCEVLIPDYGRLVLQPSMQIEQLAARIIYSVSVQVQLQAQILSQWSTEGGYGYGSGSGGDGDSVQGKLTLEEACTSQELAILQSPRDEQPQLEVWESPVPLVLVASYYEPDGELMRPIGQPRTSQGEDQGDGGEVAVAKGVTQTVNNTAAEAEQPFDPNIIWLDPYDDMALLRSLHLSGHITLAQLRTTS